MTGSRRIFAALALSGVAVALAAPAAFATEPLNTMKTVWLISPAAYKDTPTHRPDPDHPASRYPQSYYGATAPGWSAIPCGTVAWFQSDALYTPSIKDVVLDALKAAGLHSEADLHRAARIDGSSVFKIAGKPCVTPPPTPSPSDTPTPAPTEEPPSSPPTPSKTPSSEPSGPPSSTTPSAPPTSKPSEPTSPPATPTPTPTPSEVTPSQPTVPPKPTKQPKPSAPPSSHTPVKPSPPTATKTPNKPKVTPKPKPTVSTPAKVTKAPTSTTPVAAPPLAQTGSNGDLAGIGVLGTALLGAAGIAFRVIRKRGSNE